MRAVKVGLILLLLAAAGCQDKPTDPLKPKVPIALISAA